MSSKVPLSSEVINHLTDILLGYKASLAAINEDLSEAASHGDLRENREFEIAKQAEELKKRQIEQLQTVLDNCEQDDSNSDRAYTKVELMTQVMLKELGTGAQEKIYLVIDALGDVGEMDFWGTQLTPDKVSDQTNFGKTLMSKPIDSIITYAEQRYKILAVSPINYSEFFK